jgi:3-isopropylmalate/(R)-2-methylmalate dehydratase large subunit
MTQKILAAHAGLRTVKPGDLITADLDLVLGNDITAPEAIDAFEKNKDQTVFDKDKVALVPDHFAPNKDIKAAEQCQKMRSFAKTHALAHYYEVGQMGLEHVLLPEKGLVVAGNLVIGADSHTCTYGALGAFSTGVSSAEMAAGMATGKACFCVPAAIKCVLKGKLQRYVSGKDVILQLIGMIGVTGALDKSLEFTGDGIANLSMDDRFTIANMAIEAGARNGIFPVDERTIDYIQGHSRKEYTVYVADPEADYDEVIEIDLATVKPTVAFPHLPENTRTTDQITEPVYLDQVVIGSCANGRLSDFSKAAKIFEKRKVAKGVRTLIIPATQKIYLQCMELGYFKTFVEAGAIVSAPTCGPCLGGYMGVLAAGERCLATTNRNFAGRMGHADSEVYLASPEVAAASAILGRIADPSELA